MGFFTEYLPPQPIFKVLSNDFCMHITYPIFFFDSIFTFEGNGLKKASKFYHLKPIIHFWIFCIFFYRYELHPPPPSNQKINHFTGFLGVKLNFMIFSWGHSQQKVWKSQEFIRGKWVLVVVGMGNFLVKGKKPPCFRGLIGNFYKATQTDTINQVIMFCRNNIFFHSLRFSKV